MKRLTQPRLRTLRVQAGMIQDQLARRSHLSRVAVNRLENGRSTPSAATVIKVAAALGVSPSMVLEAVTEGTQQ